MGRHRKSRRAPTGHAIKKVYLESEQKSKARAKKAKALDRKKNKKESEGMTVDRGYVFSGGGYQPCHHGTIGVFVDPKSGVMIKAGGTMRGVTVGSGELAIALNGTYTPPMTWHGFQPRYLKAQYPAIEIDWRDMGTPSLTRSDWDAIVSEIREQKKDVVVFCAGGHGRTGTALAILGALMKALSPAEGLVRQVRELYCEEAVETKPQIEYIGWILDEDMAVDLGDWEREEARKEAESKKAVVYGFRNGHPYTEEKKWWERPYIHEQGMTKPLDEDKLDAGESTGQEPSSEPTEAELDDLMKEADEKKGGVLGDLWERFRRHDRE